MKNKQNINTVTGAAGSAPSLPSDPLTLWPSGLLSSGFTLTELLIVIAVMVLLLSVAVPTISKLVNSGKEDSALGGLGAAIATSRAYAGSKKTPENYGSPGFEYQGVALILTPAGEFRVVKNFDQKLGMSYPNTTDPVKYNLYQDIEGEDYIKLPKGVGIVGLSRKEAGAPFLMAPPFAIRFDPNGHLIVRDVGGKANGFAGAVVYNSNFDGAYTVPNGGAEGTRMGVTGGRYSPKRWDPERSGKVPGDSNDVTMSTTVNFHADQQKYMMEIETMETVIGVIAFNKQALLDAFPNIDPLEALDDSGAPEDDYNLLDASPDQKVRTWLLENGRVMFFNRYSGAVIKP